MSARSRRWFIRGLALIGVGLWARAGRPPATRVRGADLDGSRAGTSGSSAALGAAYLCAFPEESDTGSWLCRDAQGREYRPDWARFARTVEALEQMRCDFETGSIVMLDGWILSRTELRLCAWASMQLG